MDGHTAVSSSAFLSTPSARRATYSFMALFKVSKAISIHALREEGDTRPVCCCTNIINFYPRPPRGGRLLVAGREIAVTEISIHALREEGDRRRHGDGERNQYFYPRPPRGGRPADLDASRGDYEFLSTPSARRATGASDTNVFTATYFYPRPPRGGRLQLHRRGCRGLTISIHALREEGDAHAPVLLDSDEVFLSTPSARRATIPIPIPAAVYRISIHALREEGDPQIRDNLTNDMQFLSTPSARRATKRLQSIIDSENIFLSTPSARRATRKAYPDMVAQIEFLSTPSARRATG